MKSFGKLLLAFLLSLSLIACSSSDIRKETINNVEQEKVENKQEISQVIVKSINQIVERKAEAVKNKDFTKYMSTVNENDKEYYKEQENWFRDIMLNDIRDYSLQVMDIKSRGKDSYLVSLKQQYHYGNKDYSLNFKSIYKSNGKEYIDCDLDFNSLETEHFIIKYTEGSRNLIDKIAKDAEEGYEIVKKNYGKAPEEKTVIKIYDDEETLRQFVKLSFQWNMAGWYEYSESIKYIGAGQVISSRGFAHELIHKVTIKDSNNNMPYWFAEGLAAYYSKDYYEKLVKGNEMTIKELIDSNLEQLTKDSDVLRYYGSAQCAVEFIVAEYGEDSIAEILNSLAKHPFLEGSGSEENFKRNEVFDLTIREVLGIDFERLDKEFKKSLNLK